jgi:hypothetical protein
MSARQYFNQKAMNTDGETTLVFSQDLSKVSLDNLEYRVTDYTDENKVTVCPPSDCKVERDSDNPKALKFTLKPEFEVLRGIVSVVRKKTTSRVLEIGGDGNNRVLQSASTSTQPDPFANPVIIKETQFSMFSALGKISAYTGLFTTVNIIRVLSLYILAGLSSPRAYFGTDILSTLFYFSIIEGPLVAYTERFLEDHIHWRLLVIDFGNPFGDWNKYCYAGSSYPKNHLYCNYLTNYGQNSIILLITFILCLIFYIASRFIRKSEEASLDTLSINRFDIRPKLRRAFTDLGLVFFINLMDALKLPIFVFSLIQFKQTSKGGEMSTGMSVAVIASAYYLYSLYMMIVMSDDTWKATQNRENRTDYENKNLTAGIDIDRMDYNLFKLGVMGMKWPTAGWQFMGPLVSFIRALNHSSYSCILHIEREGSYPSHTIHRASTVLLQNDPLQTQNIYIALYNGCRVFFPYRHLPILEVLDHDRYNGRKLTSESPRSLADNNPILTLDTASPRRSTRVHPHCIRHEESLSRRLLSINSKGLPHNPSRRQKLKNHEEQHRNYRGRSQERETKPPPNRA